MKAIRVVTSLLMVTAVVACSNKSNDIDATSRLGAGPTGRNAKIQDCQVGQLYNLVAGCMTQTTQCGQGQGLARELNVCMTGQLVSEEKALGQSTSSRLYGRLRVSNASRTRFAEMLREAQVCGTYASYDCESLINGGAFLIVDSVNMDLANVTIGAGTNVPTDLLSDYFTQLSINQPYVRFSQKVSAKSFNSGYGIQLLSIPTRVGLRLEVIKGSLGSERFDTTVYFGDSEIGTASVRRYN